jgi:CHAT domain-containing protein/tetratricopeptide (TPR) repeat protein
MERRSGRINSTLVLLLLLLLCLCRGRGETTAEAYRAARALADRNELSAASAKVDAALKHFEGRDDEWVQALKILRGEVYVREPATKDEGEAILQPELPPQYRTSEAAVRRLMALGNGDAETAQRAVTLAQKYQPHLVADTYITLGIASDFPEAEMYLRTAAEKARRAGKRNTVAIAQAVLSLKLSAAARYAEAIENGRKAIAIYEQLGMPARVSGPAGNLGWAYTLIGDYETAEELLLRAEQAAAKAQLKPEQMRWLNLLGNVKLDTGEFAEADRYYANALAIAKTIPGVEKDESQISANRARAALELGNPQLAEQLNTRALAIKRKLGNKDGELISLIIEARIEAARGQVGRAEQTLRDVSNRTQKYSTRWEAQARLGQLYANTGHRELADIEYKRAIATADLARAELADDQNARLPFFNLVAQIFDAYISLLVDDGRIEEALGVAELSRAQLLMEGLGMQPAVKPFVPRAIAEQRNATILSYWLGRQRSYLWVVTPQSVALHQLPPAKKIEADIVAYRRDLRGLKGTLAMSGARGRALHQMLVAPAGAIPKDARVIIVADGKLHELNFETLVSADHYWIEDVVLSSASSLKLLAHATRQRPSNDSILLVGNAPTVEEDYPSLPHASAEIAGIKRYFEHNVVLDNQGATPAAYHASDPGRFEYIHFVAHGIASRERPLESAVVLARDAKGYKLFARDIIDVPLHARLVTISSCHGAGTRTYTGEGLVGLAWAFLAAGSENVIGALWEVKDVTTPKLMEHMYGALREGNDPAVALRKAKLELVRSGTLRSKPLYWAPFVLYTGS